MADTAQEGSMERSASQALSSTEGDRSPKRSSTTVKNSKSVWSDVPRRLTTICVGIPLVWKLLERPATAYLFFFGAHAISAWEFTMLEPASTTSASTPTAPRPLSRLLFCAASLLLAAIPESSSSLYCFGSSLAAGVFCLANSHHCVVGLMVVTLPFRAWCQLALGNSDGSTFLSTVAVLLTVWNADTGALVAGRLLGRRRSTPGCLPEWIRRVSPAKTAEGFLGGILGGIATALWLVPMLVRVFSMETTPGIRSLWGLDADDGLGAVKRITLGFVLSVLAILGDLVESSVKRLSHSKDSGSVLPGHGGILDRFDSSLLAVLFYRVVLDQATELTYGTSGDAIMESGEKEEL